MCFSILKTSIGKKQIVAATGLALILFLVAHLAGNLIIFMGPEAFNGYAKKLAGLRPALNVAEAILLFIFVVHMYVTALLVLENIRARGANQYSITASKRNQSWATRLMAYSGVYILFFVIWHLIDLTSADHHGPRSFVIVNETTSATATTLVYKSLGLYGVVWNSFSDPVHSFLYIGAMMAIGLHLSHGVQSFLQTFGLLNQKTQPIAKRVSDLFGFIVAFGYSAIPIYVLWVNYYR